MEQWIFDLGLVQIPKEKGIIINDDKIFKKKLIMLKKIIINLLVALPLYKKKREEGGGGGKEQGGKKLKINGIEGRGGDGERGEETKELWEEAGEEGEREEGKRGVEGEGRGGGRVGEGGGRGGERERRTGLKNLSVSLVMKPSEVSSFQGFTTQERIQLYKRFPNESEITLYFDSEYPNRTFKFSFQVNYLEIPGCRPKVNRFRSLSEKLVGGGGGGEEERSAPWVGGGVREEEEEEEEGEEGVGKNKKGRRGEKGEQEGGKEEQVKDGGNEGKGGGERGREGKKSKSLEIPDKDLIIVNKSPLTGMINGHGKMKETDNISMEFESEAAFYSTIERSTERSAERLIEMERSTIRKKEEEKEMIIANLLDLMEGEFSKLSLRVNTKSDPDSITRHLEKLALFSNKMI